MSEKSVKLVGFDNRPSLDPYHRDTGQATKTALAIDPYRRECWITQEYDDNSTLMSDWNGMTLRYLLGYDVTDAAKSYLESDDGQALLNRICDGHDSRWDGNNWVGWLNDDANHAVDELINQNELDYYSAEYDTWTSQDYLHEYAREHITASTTEAELAALVKGPWDDNVIFLDSPLDYLTHYRDHLRAEEAAA